MDYTKEIIVLRTSLEEIEKKLSLVRKSASVDYQTQIDKMKSDVNACQNSLSSIEQDLLLINGVLSTHDTKINTNSGDIETHTTQLENIETALSSCQSSISTLNSQVSSLEFEMNIANGNITYLTSTLNSTVFDLELLKVTVNTTKTDILTLKSQMSTAQANISTNASDIDTLQGDVLSAEADIATNAGNLSALQSSLSTVAFSGDYDDLTNKPSGGGGSGEEDEMASEVMTSSTDEFYEINEYEIADANNETKRAKIHFICSPEMYIEGNVDVFLYAFQYNYQSTVRLYYEEELVFEKVVTFDTYEQVFNFPFKIYPKNKKGHLTITLAYDQIVFLKNATFHITSAKNFLFLNNNLRWTITVYKHKYYVGHNRKFPNDYFVMDANNFNFSNPQQFLSATPVWCTYFPKPTFTNGILTIDENYVYALAKNVWNDQIRIYDMNASVLRFSKYASIGCTLTYFTDHSTTLKYITVTHVNTETGELSYWSGHSRSIFEDNYLPYKINGVPVETGCWIANNAVSQIDMDNAPYNVFQGSVAVRDDGMCVYFPHYNATYTIELGIGRRPTAFRQENGNLHIYIGRNNYVIKFVLEKNQSTNQYEIVSQEKIYGVEQYYETLDNKAIYLISDQIKLVNL